MDKLSPVAMSAARQTRVSAFLMSCHGAHARQLVAALPLSIREHWQSTLHAHYFHEIEIVSLLARTTEWTLDLQLPYLMWQWEIAWQLPASDTDTDLPYFVRASVFGHALHSALRPALLCQERTPNGAFAGALHAIELESSRLLQAHILLLRSPQLAHARPAIEEALEANARVLRTLWNQMLANLPD